MNAVNWVLINLSTALIWAWEGFKSAFIAVFTALDAILNPVLSPLLSLVNPVCTFIGDVCFAVIGLLPVWLGITVISAVAGVVMLVAFGRLSNQEAIGDAKDDIKANLLALKLYKDQIHVTWTAQWRLLWAILRLQRYMLVPVLVLLPPMVLALAQMGVRYQWRPLRAGERTIVKLRLTNANHQPQRVALDPNPGFAAEVGPVLGGGEYAWRIKGNEAGRHRLMFHVDDRQLEKELVVGDALVRVGAERTARRWTAQLLHPVEAVIPDGISAESVTVLYPGRDSWVYGANYWVLYFFVVSMAAAIVLRPVFGVRF